MKNIKKFLAVCLSAVMLAAAIPLWVFTTSAVVDDSNLLNGKTVAISGNGVGAWDSATEGTVKYRANLTDGNIAEGMSWVDNEWFGFYYGTNTSMLNTVNGVGSATVDLGGAYSLTKVAVHILAGDSASGISAPIINAFYSMDNGESYLPMQGQFVSAVPDGVAFWAEMALENTKATHVKFEFINQNNAYYVMIDEITAYGTATTITDGEIQHGGATNEEKQALRDAVAAAKKISYKDYGAAALKNIRDCYDKAIVMLASTTASKQECNSQAQMLLDLLNVKANILSVGKPYKTAAVYRGDGWDDDGVRLTDGKKCVFDGGTYSYSGWKEETYITVDLGSVQQADTFSVYLAAGTWGIALPMPDSFIIEVLISEDDVEYTSIGTNTKLEHTGGSTAYSDAENSIWGTFLAQLALDTPVNARYVKFQIVNEECTGFIWTDEVEISLGETSLSGGVYVTGINERVDNGECIIFTSDFNGGVIDVENAGIMWTSNVVAKWNQEKNGYIVTQIAHGKGESTPAVTLAQDEILIAAHVWDGEVENPVIGSDINVKQVYNARIGDRVKLSGIDLENTYITVAPYVVFTASEELQEIDYYHIDIRDATCTTGSYCNQCGNTLSDPLGHRHVDEATCTEGEFCNDCNTYISDCLGHDEGEWLTLDDGSQELRCTRCGYLLDTKPAPEKDIHIYYGLRGDINFNGKIDARDYLLLKRGYFGTYFLDEGATYRADINENEKVDARDYLLLKRAYFSTYVIPNPYVYIEIVEE